jgi:hypothetical protein
MKIFKRIDWRHTVWNADGTRAWARIAKTFALLLAFQMLGVAAATWLMHRNFEMTPNLVGLLIVDLVMIAGALFFVPEPEK